MAPTDPFLMPRFNDLQGSCYYSLPLKPPFSITNLSSRLFPLRANLDAVQSFCDNYVNIIPKEVGRFRACSPYLFLMMLDYGSLALEATNLGWFSQHEIMFCVPVEWYKVVNGEWIFHDWCMLTPFIFVDDDLSLNMGRTVAGWPKTLVSMTPTLSQWMKNPLAPVSEATVSAGVFPELYAGKRMEERVFLEIERNAPVSAMRLPVDTRSPMAPWTIASNMAESMSRLGRDSLNAMRGLGIMPTHAGATPANYQRMMQNAASSMNPRQPNLTSNILNLKQFRASEEPDRYCYQALTIGAMKFTSFNGMGLLGEQALMAGDLSGGYSIKLHEWPSLPITRLLGLDVTRRWAGNGAEVAELKPVMPYWYDCNMTYDTGYNVAWRTRDAIWHDLQGRTYEPRRERGEVIEEELQYNSTLGPSSKPIAGPFRFSGTTVRVMPLLAKRESLVKFVNEYLNEVLEGDTPEHFEVWSPECDDEAYVYMTATSIDYVTSRTNNVGDWADSELSFLIPVKCYTLHDDGSRTLRGVGMVPAFTFVDNVTAALAGSEVLGIPTTSARFIEAESSWMSEEGPSSDAHQALLRVDAEILPAVGEGERTQKRTIVEIVGGTPPADTNEMAWRNTGERWGSILREELHRKKETASRHEAEMNDMRALALELLGNRVPLALYTLKQFRDNADPDNACYQSLVQISETLYEVLDIREIERPITIRMHDFPTQALVQTLGLIGKPVRGDGFGIAYALQPVRPFWMRVTKDQHLGQPLWYRASTAKWAEPMTGTPPKVRTPPSFIEANASQVGPGAGMSQDEGDPRQMVRTIEDWKAFRREKSDDQNVPRDRIVDAIEAIDPQMVIESILSREWGNYDVDARWRVARRELVSEYHKLISGIDAANVLRAESAFFQEALRQMGKRPGDLQEELGGHTFVAEKVAQLGKFTAHLIHVERAWSSLFANALDSLYPLQRGLQKASTASASPRIIKEADDVAADFAKRSLEDPAVLLWLVSNLTAIAKEPVLGEPAAPENDVDFADRDNGTRLQTMMVVIQAIVQPLMLGLPPEGTKWGKDVLALYATTMPAVWASRDTFREAVALARERCQLQREALFNHLSKNLQKPDYCVRRDAAGPDKNAIFPMAESWDEQWYAGPDESSEATVARNDAMSERMMALHNHPPAADEKTEGA